MANDDEHLKRLAFGLGGMALGAFLLNSHNEESRKSEAEKDDPEGVERLSTIVGDLLEEWNPPGYECEDEYTEDLYAFLCARLPEALAEEGNDDEDEDDFDDDNGEEGDEEDNEDHAADYRICCRPSTIYGIPDILIDDRLALELKVNPSKGERDRLVGQCCRYSQEWVTWAVVIDMPQYRVRELEELLRAKSLYYIEVIPFN